jgi:hypothetical protein
MLAVILPIAALLLWMRLAHVYERDSVWASLISKTLWEEQAFDTSMVADLPLAARRFFLFAIEPGTPLRTVAELKTTGNLRLDPSLPDTIPLQNHQALAAPHGSLSRHNSTGRFFTLSGTTLLHEAQVLVAFWRCKLIPFRRKSRDCSPALLFERMAMEAALWTPAALLPQNGATWHGVSETVARTMVSSGTLTQEIELTVEASGQLIAIRGIAASTTIAKPTNFRTFDGYRLPTLVEFEASGEGVATPLFAKNRLDSIRFIGPWIGSSHS